MGYIKILKTSAYSKRFQVCAPLPLSVLSRELYRRDGRQFGSPPPLYRCSRRG
jgi:hypothetical protein